MEASNNAEVVERNDTPRPVRKVNVGTPTVIGIFAGMLYGASKEAVASASKDAEVSLKLGSTPDKREQYRLMRDAITRGSIVGGVRLGMFAATFYGMQNFLAEKRGVNDILNIVGAGSATGAAFGLILPGSLLWRARNAALGAALGVALCFPLGSPILGRVQLMYVGKANAGASPDLDQRGEVKSGAGAATERLDGKFK